MKAAVILSGSGVYDGSEIQEAVFTLLHLAKSGFAYQCFAPDIAQHHVINHRTGEEMPETRNVLTEAARIARGDIKPLSDYRAGDFDALVLPGGFGVAKNLTKWAFEGPAGAINADVEAAIRATVAARKAVAALCMAPTTVAKALAGTGRQATLTIGTTAEASPYPIADIAAGVDSTGAKSAACSADQVCVDPTLRIVTVPCYMMEADIVTVERGVANGIAALKELVAGTLAD